jgi:hypothetical protein
MSTQGYRRQWHSGTGEIFLEKSVLTKFVSLAWSWSEKNANNTTQLRASSVPWQALRRWISRSVEKTKSSHVFYDLSVTFQC